MHLTSVRCAQLCILLNYCTRKLGQGLANGTYVHSSTVLREKVGIWGPEKQLCYMYIKYVWLLMIIKRCITAKFPALLVTTNIHVVSSRIGIL